MSRTVVQRGCRRSWSLSGCLGHFESLEARLLLSATAPTTAVEYADTAVGNPFELRAVTAEQMVARTKTHDFVPDELIVALSLPLGRQALTLLDDLAWDNVLGLPGLAFESIPLSFQPSPGESTVLVRLTLDGTDVISTMRYLEGQPAVLWSAPNFRYDGTNAVELTPNDPGYNQQYFHTLMQNDDAWDITLGDPSIIVAVTDDGLQLNHPDLNDNIWVNPGEIPNDGLDNDGNGYVDDVRGWDFVHHNNDPNPQSAGQTHGTHVAGILAAETNNGLGVAGTAGGVTIMPLQFYDQSNGSLWTASVIAEAYAYAANNGARIVTTSYNVDGWVGDPTFTAGLQYMYDQGVLHFNSAGNGNQLNPVRTTFEQTLFVANTNAADIRSSTSNYGIGIDVSAPGTNIYSTFTNSGYGTSSGTSMASPNAAGVAALIWSQNPTWSREQVAAQLLANTDNINASNPNFYDLLGTGRVNSFSALTNTLPVPKVKATFGLPADGSTLHPAEVGGSFAIQFNQLLDPDTVNSAANFELRGAGIDGQFNTIDDEFVPLSFPDPYMVATNRFDIFIDESLEIGKYRFAIKSDSLSNAFGVILDGDNDEIAGGAFEVTFDVVMADFQPVPSEGSLVLVSRQNPGSISFLGDVDQFSFAAQAGERVTAWITPSHPDAIISAEFVGGSGPVVGAPGQGVVVPLSPVAVSGLQSLRLQSDTVTSYQFDVYRNANVEGVVESTTPIHFEDSYLDQISPRFAAIGKSDGTLGGIEFNHYRDATRFVDIAALGTPLNLDDDGESNITSTVGNQVFPAGPLTVGNNGVLTSGWDEAIIQLNGALPVSSFDAALFPFWDDLDSDTGNVYWSEQLVGGINTLIVQWDNRPHYSNLGSATFQIQVFQSGPVQVRYAYKDVVFNHVAFDGGASATIGLQTNAATGYLYNMNSAVLVNGDVIDIVDATPAVDVDTYALDLTPFVGRSIDVVVAGTTKSLVDQTMELLDPSDNVVAVGTNTPTGAAATNFDLAIFDFVVTQPGIHHFRLSANVTTEYQIVVTDHFLFDAEPNDQINESLRSLTNVSGSLGRLVDNTDRDLYSIQLTTQQRLDLYTVTPFDLATQTPTNVLDPIIEIINPADGTVFASDDNSAGDGKNAVLSFTPLVDGVVFVSVASASGLGDYVLHSNLVTLVDGDFNDDGNFDCADVNLLTSEIAAATHAAAYDLTEDGLVDLQDLDAWLVQAGERNLGSGSAYLLGDADLDGNVDGGDFIVWNNHKFSTSDHWCDGDFNADGFVDGNDFIIWNQNKFMSSSAPLTALTTSMSEPITHSHATVRGMTSALSTTDSRPVAVVSEPNHLPVYRDLQQPFTNRQRRDAGLEHEATVIRLIDEVFAAL